MKLIALFAIIGLIALIKTTPTCVATNYCMSCDSTTANKCMTCFNWGSGKVGARAYNSSSYHCTTTLTLTTANTMFYSGSITTTTTNSAGTGYNNVWQCKKTYLNYTGSSGVSACSDTASPTTCTKISNCEQSKCHTTSGGTTTSGCVRCKRNYGATITSSTPAGATACSGSVNITNCEYEAGIYGGSTTARYCYSCKSKYATNNAMGACTSYTTDSNCRQLQTDGTNCYTCWHSYYWNATKCKLAANLLSFVLIGLAAFFFN